MNKTQIMGILAVFIVAGAGIASAFQGNAGGCEDGTCERPNGEEMEARQVERELIHQAALDGDWELFSTLTLDHEGKGMMSMITEETFPQMTEIAIKMEEVRTLRQELADDLGIEIPEGRFKGKRRGFGMGQRMGGFGGCGAEGV